eukprot:288117-Prorocentrum_minimum.AAC.2
MLAARSNRTREGCRVACYSSQQGRGVVTNHVRGGGICLQRGPITRGDDRCESGLLSSVVERLNKGFVSVPSKPSAKNWGEN